MWKPNPPEVEWLLCVELYEASDVPFKRDPKILISVGPHQAETVYTVKSDSSNGRAQWFQTIYMKLMFPDDLEQVPQIFVNLYKGDERASFVKFTPQSIRAWSVRNHDCPLKTDDFRLNNVDFVMKTGGFEDMAPAWEEVSFQWKNPDFLFSRILTSY